MGPYNSLQPSHRILEEEKPTPPSHNLGSREFDGTYSVKPQVFGTYSAKAEQVQQDYRAEPPKGGAGYSALGRPDTRALPGQNERYTYDARGGGVGVGQHSDHGRDQYGADQNQYGTGYASRADPVRDRKSGGSFDEYQREGAVEEDYDGVPFGDDSGSGNGGGGDAEMGRPYGGGPPPPSVERGVNVYDRESYGDLYRGERGMGGAAEYPRYGDRQDEGQWDQRQGTRCIWGVVETV